MPTVVTKTLDSTGAGDYTTFSAWVSFVGNDLVTADEQHILECVDTGAYFDMGTSTLDMYGVSTDATRNIIIRAQSGSETNLTKGSGFQFYSAEYYDHLVGGSTNYITYENLEFVSPNATQTAGITNTHDMTFTNCLFEGGKYVITNASNTTYDHLYDNCKFEQVVTSNYSHLFTTWGNEAHDVIFRDCEFISDAVDEYNSNILDLAQCYNYTFERCTITSTNQAYGCHVTNSGATGGYYRFYACKFSCTNPNANNTTGFAVTDNLTGNIAIDIYNCEFGGFPNQVSTNDNTTYSTITIKNTISDKGFGSYGSRGFDASSTNNANATGSSLGSNSITLDNDDCYDLGSGDLRLITGSSLLGAGVDLTATVPKDVLGVTYTTPMNIGAEQATYAITATELKYTVKADGTGDYTTLSGALAGAKTTTSSNTITADKYVTIECYDQGSLITDVVDISGWTTGFRTPITIQAAVGSETTFSSGTGFGITSSSTTTMLINVNNVTVKNIEIHNTNTISASKNLLVGNSGQYGGNFVLDSCFATSTYAKTVLLESGARHALVKDCTVTQTNAGATEYCLRTNDWGGTTMTVQDCYIETLSTQSGCKSVMLAGSGAEVLKRCIVKATAGAHGIRITSTAKISSCLVIGKSTPITGTKGIFRQGGPEWTSQVYNVVVTGFDTGITNLFTDNMHDIRCRNSVVFNCNTSWTSPTNTNLWDLGNSKFNASFDTSAADILGSDSVTGITSSDFNDTSTGDYRLASTGSALEDAGFDVSGFSFASATDLNGVAWTVPYNIGTYEGVFVSGGSTTHNGVASLALVFAMDENAIVSGATGTAHTASSSQVIDFTCTEDCSNASTASSSAITAFTCTEDASVLQLASSNNNAVFSNVEDASILHSASASHEVITSNTEDLGVRHYATSTQTLSFTNTEDCSVNTTATSSQAIEFANTTQASVSIPATASTSLTFSNTEDVTVAQTATSTSAIVFSNDEDASIVHSASASHELVSSSTEDLGVRHTATSSQAISFNSDTNVTVVRPASASVSVLFSINEDASVQQSASSSAVTVFSNTTTVHSTVSANASHVQVFNNDEDASIVHSASASHEVITSNTEDLGVRHYASSAQAIDFTCTDTPSVLRSTSSTANVEFSNTSSTLLTLNASASSAIVFSNTANPVTIVFGSATHDLTFSNDEDCSNHITLSTPIDYVWTDESTWTDWLSWAGLDQLNHSTITAGDEDTSVHHVAISSSVLSFSNDEDCSVQHNATNSSDVIFTNDEDASVKHNATASHDVITTADEDAHVLHKATATISVVFSNRLDEYYVDHQASVNHNTIFSNEEDAHVLHKATASHNVITRNDVDADMLAVIPHNTIVIGEETRTIVIGEETRTISINELL